MDAVALAHRRLKIIDLSAAGDQPMTDAELGLHRRRSTAASTTTANCARELERDGYRFFSHQRHRGDPQGLRPLGRATAWSTSPGCSPSPSTSTAARRLMLARDRLGIKPLYLYSGRTPLRFASTLPALLAGGGVDTDA